MTAETRVLLGVIALMLGLLAAGWLVITVAHLYFGALWVPVAVAVLIRNHTTRRTA